MNLEEITNEAINDESFKSFLREFLARKIADKYVYDDSFEKNLIKEEIRNIIKETAREMLNSIVNEYYELNIESTIQDQLKSLTKADVVEILKGKFNQQ